MRKRHPPIRTGDRFGKLTVRTEVEKIKNRRRYACICDCGYEAVAFADLLKVGGVRSCGCLRKETAKRGQKSPVFKHGMVAHPVWKAWQSMKNRCLNPKCPSYPRYGGRGITVCDRWLDVENFIADMLPGWSPGLELDRTDNALGYSPDNCRWVTRSANQSNKRSNVWIETPEGRMTIAQAAKLFGLNHCTIKYRLSVGKIGKDLVKPSSRPK